MKICSQSTFLCCSYERLRTLLLLSRLSLKRYKWTALPRTYTHKPTATFDHIVYATLPLSFGRFIFYIPRATAKKKCCIDLLLVTEPNRAHKHAYTHNDSNAYNFISRDSNYYSAMHYSLTHSLSLFSLLLSLSLSHTQNSFRSELNAFCLNASNYGTVIQAAIFIVSLETFLVPM